MALILPRRKAGAVDISQLFSVDLYTGNGSTQTITNGVDLSTNGGLVWFKRRDDSLGHVLQDTQRGTGFRLATQSTGGQNSDSTAITSFNTDGFSVGSNASVNTNSVAAWTFRKSPNFFDVVTYTGNGTAGRTISHNLGVAPGMIVVKRTDSAADWIVWHRSIANTEFLKLNGTDAKATGSYWNNTTPTSSVVTLGSDAAVNANTAEYVIYLFGHDED